MKENCIVWGAGNYGRRLIPMLKEEGYAITAFCDTNAEMAGKYIEEYKIISPKQAEEMCRTDRNLTVIIGIFDMDAVEEVRETIQGSFVKDTKIQTGHHIQDSFENRLLLTYHQNMVFQWEVDLEKYFLAWLDNMMSEVGYWVKDVADTRGERHEYYVRCVENHRFTHRDILRRVKAGEIVMDIGCGLVSKFGEELENGEKVQLVPVDALAHYYNILNGRMRDSLGKITSCRFGMFEFLGNIFGSNYADYIIIDNALDHCIDPWRSLVECLYVLKTDGRIYLNHRRAEAVYEGWTGLHKWNVDCSDGKLLIWNKENAVNVTERLKGFAEVYVKYDDSVSVRECQNVGVEIVKKKEFELSSFFDMRQENGILTKFIEKLMAKLALDGREFLCMLE